MSNLFDIGRPTGAVGGIAAQEEQGRRNRDSDQDFRRKKTEFMDYLLDADKRSEERKAAIATAKATQKTADPRAMADIATARAVQKTADPRATADVAEAELSTARDRAAMPDVEAEQTLTRTQTELEQKRAEANAQLVDPQFKGELQRIRLEQKKAEANLQLVNPQFREELQRIHYNMSDAQYDQATRVYSGLTELVAMGIPQKEAYEQQRNQLAQVLSMGTTPDVAEEWLNKQGITADYSESAYLRFVATSSFGLHNAATQRQEHILNIEYEQKRQLEMVEGQNLKADNADVDPYTTQEINDIGDFLSNRIDAFSELEGKKDDAGNYTKQRGELVRTISLWSHTARALNKQGDTRTMPVDMQSIATDLLNHGTATMFKGGISPYGWSNGGKDFDGNQFLIGARYAMQQLEIARMDPRFVNVPTSALWDTNKERILAFTDMMYSTQNMIRPEDLPKPGDRVTEEEEKPASNKGNRGRRFEKTSQKSKSRPRAARFQQPTKVGSSDWINTWGQGK